MPSEAAQKQQGGRTRPRVQSTLADLLGKTTRPEGRSGAVPPESFAESKPRTLSIDLCVACMFGHPLYGHVAALALVSRKKLRMPC